MNPSFFLKGDAYAFRDHDRRGEDPMVLPSSLAFTSKWMWMMASLRLAVDA